jgi:hypothetical protein
VDDASKRSVLLVAALAYATVAVVPFIAAIVLLFIAETWRGHVYAVAGICLLVLPPLVVRVLLRRRGCQHQPRAHWLDCPRSASR